MVSESFFCHGRAAGPGYFRRPAAESCPGICFLAFPATAGEKGRRAEHLKKGDIVEGIIEKLLFPNRGVVTTGGDQILVKNGIPGQKVRIRVLKKRKGRLEGQILEIMEPSPLETEQPGCSIFPSCGGCMYRTLPYEKQLDMKSRQILELLDPVLRIGLQDNPAGSGRGFEEVFEGILPSPRTAAYRNKMEYSFGDERKDGPLTLGLHKKGSTYDILTASDCRIVHEDFNKILSCVLEYFCEKKVSYYHKLTHEGYLRHLLLRRSEATGEVLVALVTSSQQEQDLQPLVSCLLKLPLGGSIGGILHILNDSVADVVQSDETRILFGRDFFFEELLGLRFKITPFSFFQTNSRGAEVLYQTVREMIGDVDHATVFDLYSGTGTIAQMLSPAAERVIGVEIVEEAVEAARENAALNGLDNCSFLAGDVLKMLDEIREKPDYIILDPPREGIHPKALPKIMEYGVERMVYVSCKPTSLARDLEVLLQNGYQVERIKCVDMFPGTVHVECVVLMSRVEK
jgi:23S rRNA (uracil1939-C5)-methyltransferase